MIESQLAAIAPGREIRVFEITYLIQQTSLNALCVLLPPFAHSYNNIRDENNIAHFQKLIPADFANNFPASDYTAQQQVTIGDQLLAGLTLLRDRAGMLYDLPTFDMPIETILEFIQADLPNFASDSEKVRSYNKDCLGIGATYRILMYLIENFDINLSALEQSRLRVNFIKRATKRKLQHVANTPEQACPFKH